MMLKEEPLQHRSILVARPMLLGSALNLQKYLDHFLVMMTI